MNVKVLLRYLEGKRRYSLKLWKSFTDMFNWMPVAAIIDDKIFCVHGGLSPELNSLEQLNKISRPTDIPSTGKKFRFIKACYVISFGLILQKNANLGKKTIEEFLSFFQKKL